MDRQQMPVYVVVTPVRNEEKNLEHTIRSMICQTIRPEEWIIVNDGSSDLTGEIIDRYAASHDWIHAVHRPDRGYRKAGGGVIEAFYEGYDSIHSGNWDFIVKLDGDLSFDPAYFEICIRRFQQTPNLGICGGLILNVVEGRLIPEKDPLFHVRGASKIYRRSCWDDIGGLLKAPGWDTLDEVKANMLGWQTRSFFDLELVHLRCTGQADGAWSNWVKNGRANFISGYHPVFMLLKCIKRVFQEPYFLCSLGLLYGFVSGYLKGIPQTSDKDLIRYLRHQQIRRLFFMESIWK